MPILIREGVILRPIGNGTEYCIVTNVVHSDALDQPIVYMANIHNRERFHSCPMNMVAMLYEVLGKTEMSGILYAKE